MTLGVLEAPRVFPERSVYAAAFVVFAAAAGATLYFCTTMDGGMEMPGQWTMSMMWMPMRGQSAVAAASMFLGMWAAMMVAMMLPSALPMILLYRRAALFRKQPRVAQSLWLLSGSYFLVWVLFGVGAYILGRLVAVAAMEWTAVSLALPASAGLALSAAGAYQLSPWKSACLKHCRDPLDLTARHLDHGRTGALHLGLHHGAFCAGCCWALMVIQLVLGVMSIPVMIAVAAVIAFEKLLVAGPRIARGVGYTAIVGGVGLVAHALF